MKTYVESIRVDLNDNFSEAEWFNSLSHALEEYERYKKNLFGETGHETIFESGEREITDGEDTLSVVFIYNKCQDDEFEMLHKASIATL